MNLLIDTHILIWYIAGHPNLNKPVKTTNKRSKSVSNSVIVTSKPARTTSWAWSPRNYANLSKPARTTNKPSKSTSNTTIATSKPARTTSWAWSQRSYGSMRNQEAIT